MRPPSGPMRAAARRRVRSSQRGLTSVEIAAGVAVLGSLLAVAVPAFVRNMHASHLVEATDGLAHIQEGAAQCVRTTGALPPAAPLTPQPVPRGERVVDPPGIWEQPGWKAVDFRAAPEGLAHRYSFETELPAGTGARELVARAHGDLDGDGVLSTFEVRVRQDSEHEATAVPGMIVEQELE